MIALLQRVSEAAVHVRGRETGRIGRGILVFVAAEKGDRPKGAKRLIQRILGYRVFNDESGRMNRSVADTGGGVLLVPQFTLAADTHKGTRASFTPAAPPDEGEYLFNQAVKIARENHDEVATGEFGADMQVSLINDGPVTFWLAVPPEGRL